MTRPLAAFIALCLPLLVAATPLTIVVHVAVADGKPAATDAWVDARITDATEAFTPAGVRFVRARAPSDETIPADIVTVADRHALAAHAPRDGSIHVFVVRSLADKDKSGSMISGVHWRYAGGRKRYRGRRYVILGRVSRDSTLAHELGHFFGLPHSAKPQLLMTTPLRLPGAQFSKAQVRQIRANKMRYIRRRFLHPAGDTP